MQSDFPLWVITCTFAVGPLGSWHSNWWAFLVRGPLLAQRTARFVTAATPGICICICCMLIVCLIGQKDVHSGRVFDSRCWAVAAVSDSIACLWAAKRRRLFGILWTFRYVLFMFSFAWQHSHGAAAGLRFPHWTSRLIYFIVPRNVMPSCAIGFCFCSCGCFCSSSWFASCCALSLSLFMSFDFWVFAPDYLLVWRTFLQHPPKDEPLSPSHMLRRQP